MRPYQDFRHGKTEAHPSPESRSRAIDGKEVPSGSKPAASPAATSPPSPLRVSGLGCDTEFRPSGKKHGAFRIYPDSVSFARRANFRVAGEAENRRLMAVRVTAAEHHSSPLALAPTSIARQGDSASPAFLRFQCLNQSVLYW